MTREITNITIMNFCNAALQNMCCVKRYTNICVCVCVCFRAVCDGRDGGHERVCGRSGRLYKGEV